MVKQHKKVSKGLEKGPKAKIHLDSQRVTLKKVPNWKTPDHDGMTWILASKIHLHFWQTGNRNELMLTRKTLKKELSQTTTEP